MAIGLENISLPNAPGGASPTGSPPSTSAPAADPNKQQSMTGSLNPKLEGPLARGAAPRTGVSVSSEQYRTWFSAAQGKSEHITQGVFDEFILPALVKYGSDGLSGAINGYLFVRERFEQNPDKGNIPSNAHIAFEAARSALDSGDLIGAGVHAGAFSMSAKAAVTAWRYDGLY